MDRTVGVYDLTQLQRTGPVERAAGRHAAERRHREAHRAGAAGKQFFYDARDTRLARDALHELRELPQRRRPGRPHLGPHRHGRGPAQHDQPARHARAARASLHWSANFDEVQDFEGQIRTLAGGTGLMTRRGVQRRHAQPAARRSEGGPQRGPRRARGLRRLAQRRSRASPYRNADGTLTARSRRGPRGVPARRTARRARRHARSRTAHAARLHDVGTIKADQRQAPRRRR